MKGRVFIMGKNFVSTGIYYFRESGLKHMVVVSGIFDIDEMKDLHDFVVRECKEHERNHHYGWRHG